MHRLFLVSVLIHAAAGMELNPEDFQQGGTLGEVKSVVLYCTTCGGKEIALLQELQDAGAQEGVPVGYLNCARWKDFCKNQRVMDGQYTVYGHGGIKMDTYKGYPAKTDLIMWASNLTGKPLSSYLPFTTRCTYHLAQLTTHLVKTIGVQGVTGYTLIATIFAGMFLPPLCIIAYIMYTLVNAVLGNEKHKAD
eukprot:TRINITY_DN22768_c0_g1_i1.p1 TRINITY_DN22768_c0_g1~~TRINITY_DN22768_c0_g1_i1.p1  ORF type:complete len:209 (+),score=40.14 TRINITY_DN22768_c0_g1_i1:51-629(+)